MGLEPILAGFGLDATSKGGPEKGSKGGGKSDTMDRGPPAHYTSSNHVVARGPSSFGNLGLPSSVEAGLDGLMEDLHKFPPGTAQIAHLISHIMDISAVEMLTFDLDHNHDQRGYFRHVEDVTDTQISTEEEVEKNTRRVSLTGSLPNIYAAQAMIYL